MDSTDHLHERARPDEYLLGTEDCQLAHTDLEPLYRLLGTLYLEPPSSEIIEATNDWLDRWSTHAESVSQEIAEPVELMKDGIDEPSLGKQFTRLFMGLHDQLSPRPPYESLYRDGTIFGPTADAVSRQYQSVGLVIDEDVSGHPQDHLGFELHYLAELCARERDTVERGEGGEIAKIRQRQLDFLQTHVIVWLEEFHSECMSHDPDAFYRGVLDLTRETVRTHEQWLVDIGVESTDEE